ncbi:MAG: sulfurtransferase complex subunit TusC [Anaerolineae bacterium]|nr:MAG: sulfurtransferase complex subunit TusC [Anaerolineae bacterium]
MSAEAMKKVLVVMRHAPYGTFYAFEGLQTLLIMGAYELDLGVAFVDDGVYVITRNQNPKALQVKQVAQTFPALPDFEVHRFYVLEDSLKERGLTLDDLVIQPQVIDRAALAALFEEHAAVLPF